MELKIILEANLETLTDVKEQYEGMDNLRQLRSAQVGALSSLLHSLSKCEEFTEEQQTLFKKLSWALGT